MRKEDKRNYNTKLKMSNALKKLLKKKNITKITVNDIAKECNINRNTFYYHFDDINHVMKWTIDHELDDIKKHLYSDDYISSFKSLLRYIEKNKFFIKCIYNSYSIEQLKLIFYNDFFLVTSNFIEHHINTHNDERYKDFLCTFLTEATVGILMSYIQNRYSDVEIIDYTNKIINQLGQIK